MGERKSDDSNNFYHINSRWSNRFYICTSPEKKAERYNRHKKCIIIYLPFPGCNNEPFGILAELFRNRQLGITIALLMLGAYYTKYLPSPEKQSYS